MPVERKILIVDDDINVIRALGKTFTTILPGYLLLTATSGNEGLNMIKVQYPDVVILDVRLGKESGMDLLKEFRDHASTQRGYEPRFIVITAFDDEEIKSMAEDEYRVDRFLMKPFVRGQIEEAVLDALERSIKIGFDKEIKQVQMARRLTESTKKRAMEAHNEILRQQREVSKDPINKEGKTQKANSTILIVDDEENIIKFFTSFFSPKGYEVLVAVNGEDALKLVKERFRDISLILLDLRMPGLDGIEVLKSLKAKYTEIPIGIHTAYDERRDECLSSGADFFLAKPYSLRELCNRIERIVKKVDVPDEKVEIKPGYTPCAKILVVDDEVEICDLLKEQLEGHVESSGGKYTVEVAYNGKDGIAKSREFDPDITIVDIKMPHLRGDEMINILEQEGPKPKDYIVLTACDKAAHEHKFKQAGYSYVDKPFDLDKFSQTLRGLCFKHGLTKKI